LVCLVVAGCRQETARSTDQEAGMVQGWTYRVDSIRSELDGTQKMANPDLRIWASTAGHNKPALLHVRCIRRVPWIVELLFDERFNTTQPVRYRRWGMRNTPMVSAGDAVEAAEGWRYRVRPPGALAVAGMHHRMHYGQRISWWNLAECGGDLQRGKAPSEVPAMPLKSLGCKAVRVRVPPRALT